MQFFLCGGLEPKRGNLLRLSYEFYGSWSVPLFGPGLPPFFGALLVLELAEPLNFAWAAKVILTEKRWAVCLIFEKNSKLNASCQTFETVMK